MGEAKIGLEASISHAEVSGKAECNIIEAQAKLVATELSSFSEALSCSFCAMSGTT